MVKKYLVPTKTGVLDFDEGAWDYVGKKYMAAHIGTCIIPQYHNVPWFLPLKLHIILEDIISSWTDILFRYTNVITALPFYDVVMGIISCHSMCECLNFWRRRFE